MAVKKIRGRDMQEALSNVRREFGEDAVIMHTRSAGRFGLSVLGGRFVEITASPGPCVRPVTVPATSSGYSSLSRRARLEQELTSRIQQQASKHDVGAQLNILKEDIAWIRTTLDSFNKAPRTSPDAVAAILRDRGFTTRYARPISKPDWRKRWLDARAREEYQRLSAPCHRGRYPAVFPYTFRLPLGAKVVALIGPTGVGKTTTIAKLAADFALVKHKKVKVITIDTYRIAAVEQLRTFMDIIDIPLNVVTSPDEMRGAVRCRERYDLILIDTAGRSQRNKMQIAELASFIEAASPDQVHLVLSATTGYRNAAEIIEKFGSIPVHKYLITKLDEAASFGTLLNVAALCGKPLSYVTNGQTVPDDIQEAGPAIISELVTGNITI
jgi:flagellar biosynthesis protein FlhF